jgi:hypothetical protein
MTSDNIKHLILSAARALLRPVVRVLIHNGVTYGEFCKLAKTEFVDVCARDFGLQGRPTNMSRIAAMTGIDRKEVKRVRDALESTDPVQETQRAQDRLTRLLSAWHQDDFYAATVGVPKLLPLDAPLPEPSFTGLVKAYGGDIPVSTLLKELIASGCVEKVFAEDGVNFALMAVKRFYVPANNNPESLLRASAVSAELLDTLFHNLYLVGKEKKARPRFERRASNNHVSVRHLQAFEQFVDQQGQAFLERVDAWLTEHEVVGEEESVRLGVGAYTINYAPVKPKVKKNKVTLTEEHQLIESLEGDDHD